MQESLDKIEDGQRQGQQAMAQGFEEIQHKQDEILETIRENVQKVKT